MSETRHCPVPGCGQPLGVTRRGDPWAMCSGHWHSLSRVQQQRLWQAWKAWQRLERQRLRIRAETGTVPSALLSAIAEAVREYVTVRDECVRPLSPPDQQLKVAL